jgi:hypothetical protein
MAVMVPVWQIVGVEKMLYGSNQWTEKKSVKFQKLKRFSMAGNNC